MSLFKIIITTIFAAACVIGIGISALSKSSTGAGSANLVIWGTVPADTFNVAYNASSLKSNKLIKITYVQKSSTTFDADFTEALAEGIGPDIVVVRDDYMFKDRNKLLIIPYTSYSQRSYKNTFLAAGDIFLSDDGVIAVPFMIDPLVMYWNRSLFSNNLVATPPKYWDEIYSTIDKITKKDANANVLQSTIALGEWDNVDNAKEILSTLLLQAGTPITSRNGQKVISVLNSQFDYPIAPGQSAVNFYTQFANPTAPAYTWNRSLPPSLTMFLSGKLAIYLGFASEIFSIQQKNSNLNFDVADLPQIRDTNKIVFGRMYGLAIVKQTKQVTGAAAAIAGLTEAASLKALETVTNLPPVRLDLLASKPTDAFRSVFYDSAILSKSWIDPDSSGSEKVFRDMINTIMSGQGRATDALNQADTELGALLK